MVNFIKRYIKQYIKWNWGWNLDSALRYQPLIQIIKKRKPNVIVEVGSGNHGISAYAGVPSFGVDVAFNSEVEPGLQQRIFASGDNLPFNDSSVDVVLCVDMLEHVPIEVRPGIIEELFRVACTDGIVYVAIPFGKAAEAADRRVHEAYLRSKGRAHPMLLDHVKHGLPSKNEMVFLFEEIAAKKGWSICLSENTPIWIWEWNLMWFAVESWMPGLRYLQKFFLQPLFFIFSRFESNENYRLIFIASRSGKYVSSELP